MKTLSDRSEWFDLAIFEELWDTNARDYIRIKYWIDVEEKAMKALEEYEKNNQ